MAIVSDEQVIKVLRQYNPWWRNPLAIKEENKPQKRLAYISISYPSTRAVRRSSATSERQRIIRKRSMWSLSCPAKRFSAR